MGKGKGKGGASGERREKRAEWKVGALCGWKGINNSSGALWVVGSVAPLFDGRYNQFQGVVEDDGCDEHDGELHLELIQAPVVATPSGSLIELLEESDVEEGLVAIHKLEQKRLEDESIFVGCGRAVVLVVVHLVGDQTYMQRN